MMRSGLMVLMFISWNMYAHSAPRQSTTHAHASITKKMRQKRTAQRTTITTRIHYKNCTVCRYTIFFMLGPVCFSSMGPALSTMLPSIGNLTAKNFFSLYAWKINRNRYPNPGDPSKPLDPTDPND